MILKIKMQEIITNRLYCEYIGFNTSCNDVKNHLIDF